MEYTTTVLIGLGGVVILLCVLLAIVELATIRTIRPPKRATFTYMRLAANQYQTVFLPAVGALISGLFVSLSASFFYEGIRQQEDSWLQPVGLTIFLLGVVALMVTLRSVLQDVGEPGELARDPFAIRAAAEETAKDPRRGELDPDALTRHLDDWKDCIGARSMGLSAKKRLDKLDRALVTASEASGFRRAAWCSLHVYFTALVRFPFLFVWPLLGYVSFSAGIIWFACSFSVLDFTASLRPWVAVALFVFGGALPVLFYCAARGNRARLWHRVNLVALDEARAAIEVATKAYDSVAAEDERINRILSVADSYFRMNSPAVGARTILQIGRFRLSIDSDTSPGSVPAPRTSDADLRSTPAPRRSPE